MATPLTFTMVADGSTIAPTMATIQANITAALSGIDAKMRETAQKTQQTTEAWRTSLTNLSQATVKLVAPQQQLSQVMLQTGKVAETQVTSFDKLHAQYKQTEQATTGVTRQMSSLVSSMRGLAAAAGISFSIAGLVSLTKDIVEAGIAHDRLMLSLKGALGTAQAAGEAYAFVEGVANRLGIGLLTAVEGFAKLSAATQGTVVQGQQTRDLFVAISEASRVMGLTSAETGGIVVALTQIIGKNTVSMEELRQQLGERLPSALRLTAKEMGLTTSRFIEMVSKGEVLAVDFIPAVTRAMQQMGKEAPAAAQSVQAALERVGNAWLTLKVTIAQSGLLDLVARIAEEMTRVINQTTNWLNRTTRLSGELGLTAMVGEMQRLTQEIQTQQEMLAKAPVGSPMAAQARNATIALEAQRDALAEQIAVKQKVVETEEKVRTATDASTKAQIDAQAAEDKRTATLRDLSKTFTGLEDNLKGVQTQLDALRSFDVPSLQAMKIDPFAKDFEQRWKERETALLKQQQDLLNKRAGISKAAGMREAQEAGQSAIEVAKAREEALITSLKREELLIQQSAEERRRIIDETAAEALRTQGPSGVDAIEATRQRERLRVAVETVQALETIQVDSLTKQEALRAAILQAEIAAAGKNLSAKVAAEKELSNLHADMENERAEVTQKRVAVEQQLSKKSVDEQIKDARALNTLIEETAQDQLRSRVDLIDEQIALTEAQMDGEVVSVQAGQARILALQQQRGQDTEVLYRRQADAAVAALDAEVRATAIGQAQIADIYQERDSQIAALQLQQQTQVQRALNEQASAYRQLAEGISHTMSDVFEDLFQGTLELGESIKRWFIRLLADMAAYATTHAIILPILTSVLGGVTGGAGGAGGAGGILQTILGAIGVGKNLLGGGAGVSGGGVGLGEGVGILSSLKTIGSGFTTSLTDFTKSLLAAGSTISRAFGGPTLGILPPGVEMEGVLNVGAGSVGGTVLGGLGGAAAIAGGIYGALKATNTASRAAYAASAAAGTAALASTALVAAGVIAASTGWTGIGLIAAAVTAILGTVAEMVIKPAGPALAVGRPSGVGIGVQGGRLTVAGDLGTQVMRQEKVNPGVARGVQAQMEEGITHAVTAIVQTINAVALKPEALLGPTQDALTSALAAIQPLNTANAKKMGKDIEEQLRFINVQMVAGMLGPINEAFNQLRDMGSLEEQITRLPGTTQGLVDLFTQMNEQIAQVATSENTDVLRQLSGVRNQVENFGNRIAGTAAQTAESIVNGVIVQLEASARHVESGPRLMRATNTALEDFDQALATQITTLSTTLTSALQTRASLQGTRQTLEGAGLSGSGMAAQLDRLTHTIGLTAGRISTEIVTTAMRSLSADLRTILVQPLQVQATTVSTLFNGSMAALNALQAAWTQLSAAQMDTSGIQGQFERLLIGMLGSVMEVTRKAFDPENFAGFLRVLLSIPEALTNLNPVTQQVRALGIAMAQVVGPIQQVIDTTRVELQTPGERVAETAADMDALRLAIAQSGEAIDQVLPLYDQLAAKIHANAAAQIEVINEQAEAARKAVDAWSDVAIKAWNDWADQMTDELNAWADHARSAWADWAASSTNAWNDWADTMLKDLDTWVTAANTMVNDWAEKTLTTASQLARVNTVLSAEMSPAAQRQELLGRKADFEAFYTATGDQRALDELIQINTDLLQLAKGSDDLLLQKQSIDELRKIQKHLADQLFEQTGYTDPVLAQIAVAKNQEAWLKQIAEYQKVQTEMIQKRQEQEVKAIADREAYERQLVDDQQKFMLDRIEQHRFEQIAGIEKVRDEQFNEILRWQEQTTRAIKQDTIYQLSLIQYELQKLFRVQYTQATGQDLPEPTAPAYHPVAVTAILGGPITLARGGEVLAASLNRSLTGPLTFAQHGGMVPAMVEPGERIFPGPLPPTELAGLQALNVAVPRLQAGGAVSYATDGGLRAVQGFTSGGLRAVQSFTHNGLQAVDRFSDGGLQAVEQFSHGGLQALNRFTDGMLQRFTHPGLHAVGSPALQAGGLVRAMVEPGERVFTPPMSHAQQGALVAMNQEFPRFARGGFTVPGSGSGDTVPMMLPSGSFVLNRRASGAIGFQSGGRVAGPDHQAPGRPVVQSLTINVYQQPGQNTRELIAEITRQLRREFRSSNDSGPFR